MTATTTAKNTPATITLEMMRAKLYSAVLSDALAAYEKYGVL